MSSALSCSARFAVLLCLAGLMACDDAHEPHRVELPVETESASLPSITTNLGYEVEILAAELSFTALQFTMGGELHASAQPSRVRLPRFFATAHAHPGHFQEGDVTGELPGHHVARWGAEGGGVLGIATLIVGRYEGANLVIRNAVVSEGESNHEELANAAGVVRGLVMVDGTPEAFELRLRVEEPIEVTGIPFQAGLRDNATGALRLALLVENPFGSDTLLDDIDFTALLAASPGEHTVSSADDPLLGAFFARWTDHDFLKVTWER